MLRSLSKQFILLAFLFLSASFAGAQTQLAGEWKGTLNAGGVELRLILHLTVTPSGVLTGTLDSVDQGVNGLPVTSAAVKDGKITLTVEAVHGTYEGTVNPAASEMKGTWSQGHPFELN